MRTALILLGQMFNRSQKTQSFPALRRRPRITVTTSYRAGATNVVTVVIIVMVLAVPLSWGGPQVVCKYAEKIGKI